MNYNELDAKYQLLLEENTALKAEIIALKQSSPDHTKKLNNSDISDNAALNQTRLCSISDSQSKVQLFMSLFKGREDVYSKRWQNNAGKSGYMPVCLNEWKPGICNKLKIKCAKCSKKSYAILDQQIIDDHLRGNIVAGIYPMRLDETCHFLAIDFDDTGWQKDTSVIRAVCNELAIPVAVERSRSGNGAHVWFFFKDWISASIARKFGTALITHSMNKRHEITFKSYDRLFPNQDTMPKGGFGNLIALPLQKAARKMGNSVFIDEQFLPFIDQWEFLSSIKKISEEQLFNWIHVLSKDNELGILKQADEEILKPWLSTKIPLIKTDLPKQITIVKAGMLYIEKTGLPQLALNTLKRFAAFKNPDFYRTQAMRMPTYNKPRIISCSEEIGNYLCLPRGCEADIKDFLQKSNAKIIWLDETTQGKKINVQFSGELRDIQQQVVNKLLQSENGVLAATTAFGKTVVAANLIAERKVNTLILVHRQQLLTQWIHRLSEFLIINEELPILEKKRGRKKQQNIIGQIGAGKDTSAGILDVAIMQSLNNDEIKEKIKNYGMIIVDECHHIPAFSFEQILKQTKAKYIYGLTATSERKDGHHPIIFMHCGPIRFKVDAKEQARKRPFDHYIIPRFTGFNITSDDEQKELTIQKVYAEIIQDDMRNQLIVDDAIRCYEKGRNCLILTERTNHVESLAKLLSKRCRNVIQLTGGLGNKETSRLFKEISETPTNQALMIVATGKFIGEGFDEPRLDTLFLAIPISWKGTLQQYAGRLHRLYTDKKEVQIYDYVDIRIKMLERMYHRRLNGYAAIGYKTKGDILENDAANIIYDKNNFFQVYCQDLISAKQKIFIVSPFITIKRSMELGQILAASLALQVQITIITRPVNDLRDKNRGNLLQAIDILKNAGIKIEYRPNIHQKFAIIDERIVWYGSINLLSFGYAEESMMRLSSGSIAFELMKSMQISL